jgi:hypothetical protein
MSIESEPEYNLKDLVRDCGEADSVIISRGALETARADFSLATADDIRTFISNGGLEQPKFIRKAPWENNKDKKVTIQVDSYEFFSGNRYGYLAFVKVPTGKWLIKSLKNNDRPNPKFLQTRSTPKNLEGGGS